MDHVASGAPGDLLRVRLARREGRVERPARRHRKNLTDPSDDGASCYGWSVHGSRTILEDLALVLCVAAVTTVVFRRLRQPVVLGYLLAGMIVGPHIPIPLVADPDRINTLSELGVILVMFSVGLEFRPRKLLQVIPTSGIVGVIQIATMLSLGYLTGQAFGFRPKECLFVAAIVSMSSTMVVAKIFAEQRPPQRLADMVFGVLIVQDLAAVLLLALLTALTTGHGHTGDVLARTAVELSLFLCVIIVAGFLVVPRGIRAVAALKSPETLLVASVGLCFAFAFTAHSLGYSVALGAFIAGSLVADSGEGERVERLVEPLRDVFAAIFFVSVGMVLDPALVAQHWRVALALSGVVIVGQIASVTFGAILSGRDVKTSVQAGMSLAQIGEFSFVIASLGAATGTTRPFLYPVAVAVSALTSFTTPWLIRASKPVAIFVDRSLPKPLQTFIALYGSWLERFRAADPAGSEHADRARLVRWLAVDVALLAAVVIGSSLGLPTLVRELVAYTGLARHVARVVVVGSAVALSMPFVLGVVRVARTFGATVADDALVDTGEGHDVGTNPRTSAPRRALVVAVQLAVVIFAGVPLVALTQPFVPPLYGVAALGVIVAVLAVSFYRNAARLDAHVKAGTERLLEGIALASGSDSSDPTTQDEVAVPESLDSVLNGVGQLTQIPLHAGCAAIGQTLAELNLRAVSGASVVTIKRGNEAVAPTGRERLREGDVLGVVGTREAIDEARTVLASGDATAFPVLHGLG